MRSNIKFATVLGIVLWVFVGCAGASNDARLRPRNGSSTLPPSVELTANSQKGTISVSYLSSAVLRWKSVSVDQCELKKGNAAPYAFGPYNIDGLDSGPIAEAVTFTINCKKSGQVVATDSVTVQSGQNSLSEQILFTVNQANLNDPSGDQTSILMGGSVLLRWQAQSVASTCSLIQRSLLNSNNTSSENVPAVLASPLTKGPLSESVVYTFKCNRLAPQSGTLEKSVLVMVGAPPPPPPATGPIDYDFIVSMPSIATYENTMWSQYGIHLGPPSGAPYAPMGSFVSAIIDSGKDLVWKKMGWSTFQPNLKQLPGARMSESSYTTGNVSMSGNVLLLHLNEPVPQASFLDGSGEGNHAECSPSVCPREVAGKFGTAREFNVGIGRSETHHRLVVPHSSDLDLSGDLSMEAWIKAREVYGWAPILTKVIEGPQWAKGYGLFWHATKKSLCAYVDSFTDLSSGTTEICAADKYVPNDSWDHVAVTYNSGSRMLKIYLNAREIASRVMPSGAVRRTNTQPLYVGFAPRPPSANPADPLDGDYFNGAIDEVALYNRTLSPDDIEDRYERGQLSIRFQVRACPSLAACSNQIVYPYVGPGNLTTTFYSEIQNSFAGQPLIEISPIPGRYLQYRFFMERGNLSDKTPILQRIQFLGE